MGHRPRAPSSRLGLHLAVLAVALPRALAVAVPSVSSDGVDQIKVVNRITTFSLTFSNKGDTVGYLPFVDIGEAALRSVIAARPEKRLAQLANLPTAMHPQPYGRSTAAQGRGGTTAAHPGRAQSLRVARVLAGGALAVDAPRWHLALRAASAVRASSARAKPTSDLPPSAASNLCSARNLRARASRVGSPSACASTTALTESVEMCPPAQCCRSGHSAFPLLALA